RAGTGDDRSTAVPTRRLPGRRQPASRHERGGRRGAAARGGGARRGRAAPPWRRDLEREGSTRSAVPVDDDEIRLPRGHRRRDAGGVEQATRVDTSVVVAPELGPARTRSAAHVDDVVEVRARTARLDGR